MLYIEWLITFNDVMWKLDQLTTCWHWEVQHSSIFDPATEHVNAIKKIFEKHFFIYFFFSIELIFHEQSFILWTGQLSTESWKVFRKNLILIFDKLIAFNKKKLNSEYLMAFTNHTFTACSSSLQSSDGVSRSTGWMFLLKFVTV